MTDNSNVAGAVYFDNAGFAAFFFDTGDHFFQNS